MAALLTLIIITKLSNMIVSIIIKADNNEVNIDDNNSLKSKLSNFKNLMKLSKSS